MTETIRPAVVDDDSLAMLMEEVSAMAESGRPLIAGLAEIDDASMGKLGRAAHSVLASLAQGNSAAESVAALSTRYKAPIRVAMEVMAATGSTEPIHDTVRLIREANERRHQIRFAAINPMLNVIVAVLIGFFVVPWILVCLSEAEMIKTAFSPTVSEIVQAFAQDFFLAATATTAVVGLFAALLYWGLSRASRGANRFRDQATFCRWLAIQVTPPSTPDSDPADGVELGRVMEAAVEVVGPSFAESWEGVIENIRGGARTVALSVMPAGTPEPVGRCIDDLVSGSRGCKLIAFDLRWLSDLYTQKSDRHQTWWAEILPRWVMWIFMIAIMVVMLRAILLPLFEVVGGVAL